MYAQMKTPMQLLYEQLERTVIQQKGMMSYGEYESFKAGMEMSIAIIEQDGHFEKEKEVIIESFHEGMRCHMFDPSTGIAEEYYNETFNTKEK
jgi:hypothetical protein